MFIPSSPNPPTPAFYSTIHPSNRLNVGHINICSLRHKNHVITKLKDEHCLDLLVVTETWLDSSISDTKVSVQGTILLRRDRPCVDGCTFLSSCTPCREGGGICIFLKEHVKVKHILDYSHSSPELMLLRVSKGKDSSLLGCIYRSPSEPVEFRNRLATSTEQLDGETIVLLGDINVDFLRKTSSAFHHLKDTLLLPCRLANKVTEATRITGCTRTSIDCILPNIDRVPSASVMDCVFSDHHLVINSVPVPIMDARSNSTTHQTRRDYRNFNAQRFCDMLLSSDLHNNYLYIPYPRPDVERVDTESQCCA